MKFTESKLEQAIATLLGQQGFPHVRSEALARSLEEVVIEEDLVSFLRQRYRQENLTETEVQTIILQLKSLSASELYESNRKIMRWISDGFILKREDRNQKDIHITMIDYRGLEEHLPGRNLDIVAADAAVPYADTNIYKFVTQLEIEGHHKRIPDGVFYINGLPVVVFEFKSAIREEATLHDAYKQLTVRYRRDIPELFKYNAFCVISDGVNNKMGSFFAAYEYYYAWRRVPEGENPQLNKQHRLSGEGIDSLYTMVLGVFNKTSLQDIIRNFIYFPDTSKKEEKIVCRYPQYYAARALYQSIKNAQKPEGNGKGGTYFGATGSGKSFTMLFLSRLLMKSRHFASPTIVLITDRTDLDAQLSAQFINAKIFLGDEVVESVESRADLRQKLRGRQSGGIFLTTIHKFTEDTELLTDRTNVICISDEAHRSQTNLDQKVVVTQDGVRKSWGFAKYLHDSLPSATYVGFTGTPIDATLDVFGEVVDAYTMTESVHDEITVRIVYEGRAAKVILQNSELAKIEQYYEEAAEAGANDYQIDKSKRETASMSAILGDPDRLRAVAEDFVAHYEKRLEEGATVAGKAMFVCSNRDIAYRLYKNITGYLNTRAADKQPAAAKDYAQFFTKEYGSPEEWHSRKLPHRNKPGLVQFLTFRLADSLPQNVLKKIEQGLQSLSDDKKEAKKRKQYQYWLDKGLGSCALAKPAMAEVMLNALKYHDEKKYKLLAWSIMPNHVHVLIRCDDDLPDILQSWKSFTGKWALVHNKEYNLGLEKDASRFWMKENWDRFIRDEAHFNSTVQYILDNPAKAGLPAGHPAYSFTGHNLSDEKQGLQPAQIKLVMTRNKDDEKELWDLLGTDEYRKELDREFKDETSDFKVAIVVDMWLTGFDVPFLDTMYIDKPIRRHNLIQTISRVNRKYKGKNKGLVVDYIGFRKQMNLALAEYGNTTGTEIEDILESLKVVQNHLDLLAKIFYKFDSSGYFGGTPLQQLNTLNLAAEFVQATKEMETRFMDLVRRLKAAYDICAGSEQLTQNERDYIHFYLAVRSIVFKLTKGEAPDTEQMNAKVREMIHNALQSEGVEEIIRLGEEGVTEQDIFDEDYLARIARIKLPNTKIKLLQKLLARIVGEIRKVNKVKGIDFTKKMQALVNKYNERKEDDTLQSIVYEEMAEELTNLIWQVKKEFTAGEELGIDFEEKAFYDILKELCVKYDFMYPDEKLIALAKEVKVLVDEQARFPDWNKREDIKATLKVELILVLDKHGYPPVERDEVYQDIFEQAENYKKNRI